MNRVAAGRFSETRPRLTEFRPTIVGDNRGYDSAEASDASMKSSDRVSILVVDDQPEQAKSVELALADWTRMW